MLSKTWILGIPAQDFVLQCQRFPQVPGSEASLLLSLKTPRGSGYSAASAKEVLSYRTHCYRAAFKPVVSLFSP